MTIIVDHFHDQLCLKKHVKRAVTLAKIQSVR